jgi:hypothetical protein
MMRRAAFLTGSLLVACGGLPALAPVAAPARAELAGRCQALFPRVPWHATHVLEATLPMGYEGSFLAVVSADAPGRFRSILISVEGLVLYDATYSYGRIVVNRAVPPLDKPSFAQGMSADIRLLLFQPPTPLHEVGLTVQGQPACRWQRPDGKIIEATLESGERTALRLYADKDVIERDALLLGPAKNGLASDMILVAPGTVGYSLHLRLLDGGPATD